MSYAYSISARTLSRAGIAVAVVASLAVPFYDAHAQLGGLVKKAKDRVIEQQVANQVEKRVNSAASDPGAPPKFDDVTVELTNDRVSQVIRGLSAGRAVLDGANGSPSRATLIAQRDDAARQSADLSQKNAKAFEAYSEKRDASQRCRNDAIHASREKRQQANDQRMKELQAKAMSDPAFREKAVAMAQKMAVAQQKGDTAEVRRLMIELNGGAPQNDSVDSLTADKACGSALAQPAAMVQSQKLDAQANKLTEAIRQLEEQAAETEVKESKLTERQYQMARERIEAYLSAMKYNSQPRGFSAGELQALGARRADLEKVM
jgi:hypothetical protein